MTRKKMFILHNMLDQSYTEFSTELAVFAHLKTLGKFVHNPHTHMYYTKVVRGKVSYLLLDNVSPEAKPIKFVIHASTKYSNMADWLSAHVQEQNAKVNAHQAKSSAISTKRGTTGISNKLGASIKTNPNNRILPNTGPFNTFILARSITMQAMQDFATEDDIDGDPTINEYTITYSDGTVVEFKPSHS